MGRNRYFGEASAHKCPIILYQENDSEGFKPQKFFAAEARAAATSCAEVVAGRAVNSLPKFDPLSDVKEA